MLTKISRNIPKNISAARRKAFVSIFLSIVLFLPFGISEHYSLHEFMPYDVFFGENADIYALEIFQYIHGAAKSAGNAPR